MTARRVRFVDLDAVYGELGDELNAAAGRVLASGRYILGDEVAAFESEWAAACGVSSSVGVNSGLDALTCALRALGVTRGDEVVVPAHTFIATWLAVSAVGAVPVPAEPDPATGNIDPEDVARRITKRTRAIIAVHLYGQVADMERLGRFGIPIVEDAAQAHLATRRGTPAGGLGTIAAFSFYPTKNLGALGDAGAITTDDADLADRVRVIANYGSRVKYDHEVLGANTRLDPLQAAFLRTKLPHLDEWNGRRRRVAAAYMRELGDIEGLRLPEVDDGNEHVWHLFVVRHPERDRLAAHLEANGIDCLIHYPVPPHLSGAYAAERHRFGPLPLTEEYCSQALSLPMSPHMAQADVERVISAVRAGA